MDEAPKSDKKIWIREELRGLFVLGVIATLISARPYYESVEIPFGFIPVEVTLFADFILILWGLYTFFMAVSYSGDFLPGYLCDIYNRIGRVLFILGAFFTSYLSIILFIFGFINKLWVIIYPLAPFVIYKIPSITTFIEIKIKFDKSSLNFSDILRKFSGLSFILLYIFSIASILTDYYFDDRDLPIITFMSIGFATAFLLLSQEKKKTGK